MRTMSQKMEPFLKLLSVWTVLILVEDTNHESTMQRELAIMFYKDIKLVVNFLYLVAISLDLVVIIRSFVAIYKNLVVLTSIVLCLWSMLIGRKLIATFNRVTSINTVDLINCYKLSSLKSI